MTPNPNTTHGGEGANEHHPTIEVFYQLEGTKAMELLEADPSTTLADLASLIAEKHGADSAAILFLEDKHEPAEAHCLISDHAHGGVLRAHLHRCSKIKVTVNFQGQSPEKDFGPGATIAHVKKWFTEDFFQMTPTDSGEHQLQIVGSDTKPAPGVHLGTLVTCPNCQIAFDLVTDIRIQG